MGLPTSAPRLLRREQRLWNPGAKAKKQKIIPRLCMECVGRTCCETHLRGDADVGSLERRSIADAGASHAATVPGLRTFRLSEQDLRQLYGTLCKFIAFERLGASTNSRRNMKRKDLPKGLHDEVLVLW
jgi:hypothetical protein